MDLGIKVLKLPNFKIQSALFDHKNSIHSASYEVIGYWSQQQLNPEDAYITLRTRLQEAKMNHLAAELQLWVEGKRGEALPGSDSLVISTNEY